MYARFPNIPNSKLLILADGENMVFRYQQMAKDGRRKGDGVREIADVFVWHDAIISLFSASNVITRVIYYTSAVGDDDKISALEKDISKTTVQRPQQGPIQIHPRVFKKGGRSDKSKIVDMSICIDGLRHSYHRDADAILLLSGDGDYIPLIKEIMRTGTQVFVGAFSSGLNTKIPSMVDRFIDLDTTFFWPKDS